VFSVFCLLYISEYQKLLDFNFANLYMISAYSIRLSEYGQVEYGTFALPIGYKATRQPRANFLEVYRSPHEPSALSTIILTNE